VLELQNTLEELSSRVDRVKEENFRLKSENQVSRVPPVLQLRLLVFLTNVLPLYYFLKLHAKFI
jgi:hypothetical protein